MRKSDLGGQGSGFGGLPWPLPQRVLAAGLLQVHGETDREWSYSELKF